MNHDEPLPKSAEGGKSLARRAPRAKAVALEYSDPNKLPRVLAHGSGEVAKKIVEVADQNGIPVERDDALTEMLSKVGEGSVITPESFRLVADVICFLYHVDQEWRTKHAELKAVIE